MFPLPWPLFRVFAPFWVLMIVISSSAPLGLFVLLARTKSFRRAKRRLFVSFNPKYCSDVAKGTVSRWILDLIKLAYARSLVRLPDNPIRAHELRAISSSLAVVKGVPLVKVMASAFW